MWCMILQLAAAPIFWHVLAENGDDISLNKISTIYGTHYLLLLLFNVRTCITSTLYGWWIWIRIGSGWPRLIEEQVT